MEDSLSDFETETVRKTNFKKWSFRLFVDLLFAQGLLYYHVTSSGLLNTTLIMIFSILSLLFLIGACVFLILSIVNKEQRNYQYWIALIGIPLYLIVAFAWYIGGFFK